MIKLLPFKNEAKGITDKFESIDVIIETAFEYKDQTYVVVTGGLVAEGEYTIMSVLPLDGEKDYTHQFEVVPEPLFTELCDLWEESEGLG